MAYIGLGANMGDPVAQIQSALGDLRAVPGTILHTCSSLYRTPPVGPQDQPDFINAVACLETNLPAITLLHHMQDIENRYGRSRGGRKWGPRTLDLDLLLFGREHIEEENLTVPHPEMTKRGFVLYPLLEIAPDIHIPGKGAARDWLDKIDHTGIERITH